MNDYSQSAGKDYEYLQQPQPFPYSWISLVDIKRGPFAVYWPKDSSDLCSSYFMWHPEEWIRGNLTKQLTSEIAIGSETHMTWYPSLCGEHF